MSAGFTAAQPSDANTAILVLYLPLTTLMTTQPAKHTLTATTFLKGLFHADEHFAVASALNLEWQIQNTH